MRLDSQLVSDNFKLLDMATTMSLGATTERPQNDYGDADSTYCIDLQSEGVKTTAVLMFLMAIALVTSLLLNCYNAKVYARVSRRCENELRDLEASAAVRWESHLRTRRSHGIELSRQQQLLHHMQFQETNDTINRLFNRVNTVPSAPRKSEASSPVPDLHRLCNLTATPRSSHCSSDDSFKTFLAFDLEEAVQYVVESSSSRLLTAVIGSVGSREALFAEEAELWEAVGKITYAANKRIDAESLTAVEFFRQSRAISAFQCGQCGDCVRDEDDEGCMFVGNVRATVLAITEEAEVGINAVF